MQDLVWERHCGGIAQGFAVVHKNCVSVDNRLENLVLLPQALTGRWCPHATHSTSLHPHKDMEDDHLDSSVYWMAIQQIPYDPADEVTIEHNQVIFRIVISCF